MIGALQSAALRVQLPIVVFMVPLVLALIGVPLVPLAVEVALDGEPASVVHEAVRATRLVMWLLVACVTIAAAGAAMVLRVSLGAAVDRLGEATRAIARGDFRHRVGATRVDELGRLSSSIDAMAERLERLDASRRTLLASVSHELRTPITIIAGHAFTLARGDVSSDQRVRLEMMQEEAVRLAALIEDLVEASSLQAGSVQLDVERLDLADVVGDTIKRFEAIARERGVTIELRSDRCADAEVDPTRIDQVFANLIGNAVRHARPGSCVVVRVEPGRSSGSHRAVYIENEGAAIPEALAGRIFEPFVQGAQQARGRVGLGLAIAHGLAVAHGGSVVLEDRGESGVVRFRVAIPAPAEVIALDAHPARHHAPFVRRSALMVGGDG